MQTRKPINVLFLTLYPNSVASPRYRVAQFLPYLRAHGFRCTVASALTEAEHNVLSDPSRVRPFWYHAKETPRRIAQLIGAQKYDIVMVQKAIASAYLRGLHDVLRMRTKRLIYDIDDAVHLRAPHALRGVWAKLEEHDQIERMMKDADLVLAGNAWLCEEARRFAHRVEFFPTVVDTDRFTPAARLQTMVIGWIGGASTTPHLEEAEAIGDVDEVTIRCVGADPARVPWEHAEIRAWSQAREIEDIHSFTVGIMPLPKDEWTRGKCALKALQYMSCAVPCVATPYGAVLDIIADNITGLFADSAEEWRADIEWLRDPAARARLGDAGRETVESHYSLKHAAPKLAQLLESVL